MSRRALPKSERRTNNVLLNLNEQERDALDHQVERHQVETQTYLRTLILAADAGEIDVPPTLFEP
jgi:hypothetical protein